MIHGQRYNEITLTKIEIHEHGLYTKKDYTKTKTTAVL